MTFTNEKEAALAWRAIPLTGGRYEASSSGLIRAVGEWKHRKSRSPLKLSESSKGYFRVCVSTDSGAKHHYVHTLVADAFIGQRPDGHTVNHKDGCKTNNTPENLEYLTSLQNIAHAAATGLAPRGERNCNALFTEAQVLEIVALIRQGKRTAEIARTYRASYVAVHDIKYGNTWRYLTGLEKRPARAA